MNKENVPFYIPWINDDDRKALEEALKSRWLTGGPRTVNFEKKFADIIGVKHAIAVNSCTAALHLSMASLGIGAGDEVIVPVFTFAATANAPLFCGAKPVFTDINEKTFNIDPEDIKERISQKTKAIIPVHYGGQACDMSEIIEIAEDHKLQVVEDCAHSLGSEYRGIKTGNLGTIGCFSFYPTKIITTFEGGMLTTNDSTIAKKADLLRSHGMSKSAYDREREVSWYYDVVELGYNYRINEVQAALGESQLKRIDEGNEMRIKIAEQYSKKFNFKGIVTPYKAPDRTHVFHLYVIKVIEEETGINRDDLYVELEKAGIGTSLHYTPLHLFTLYKNILNSSTETFLPDIFLFLGFCLVTSQAFPHLEQI